MAGKLGNDYRVATSSHFESYKETRGFNKMDVTQAIVIINTWMGKTTFMKVRTPTGYELINTHLREVVSGRDVVRALAAAVQPGQCSTLLQLIKPVDVTRLLEAINAIL